MTAVAASPEAKVATGPLLRVEGVVKHFAAGAGLSAIPLSTRSTASTCRQQGRDPGWSVNRAVANQPLAG